MSMSHDSFIDFPLAKQKENTIYTRTNYIQSMCPIFHVSLLPDLKSILNNTNVFVAWGLDVFFSFGLKVDGNIIHSVSMIHPHSGWIPYHLDPENSIIRKTSYSQFLAWGEMQHLVNKRFPEFYNEKYKEPALSLKVPSDPDFWQELEVVGD